MNCKCVIIDDLEEAIVSCAEYLKLREGFDLVKTFTDPIEGLSFLEKNIVDVVFLDVDMPHLNGLDFIESLRSKKGNNVPKFILTTGYKDYALSGYELGVVDYLLKPFGFKRFSNAMDRFTNNFYKPEVLEASQDFFFADIEGVKTRINYREIAYVKSEGNYVAIVGTSKKKMMYTSMNRMAEILPNDVFVRVQKSYIVSINHVESFSAKELIVTAGSEHQTIPIGAIYKDDVFSRLNVKKL